VESLQHKLLTVQYTVTYAAVQVYTYIYANTIPEDVMTCVKNARDDRSSGRWY